MKTEPKPILVMIAWISQRFAKTYNISEQQWVCFGKPASTIKDLWDCIFGTGPLLLSKLIVFEIRYEAAILIYYLQRNGSCIQNYMLIKFICHQPHIHQNDRMDVKRPWRPLRQTPDAFCIQADGRVEIQTLTKCRRESDVIDICANI